MAKRYIGVVVLAALAVTLGGCEMLHGLVAGGHGPVFRITDYGAVDDAKHFSGEAVDKAIAACKEAGGGTVVVPAGHYLTGPLTMVDNMTLQVDKGATLLFDDDQAKYPPIESRWEGHKETGPHPLLFADGAKNIAITGPGTIDGQGAGWWATMDMAEHGNARPTRQIKRRPPLVQIRNCDGVKIDGPTFTNAPFWTIHFLYSQHIDMGNCRMINPVTSPNTDALNSDSCQHVVVHDCFADVGDDGFGIKAGRDEEGRKDARPTEDITYIRCHVAHAHGVCVIGSEMSGSVRHVRFLDCDGDGTDNGIRIKSTRGRGGVVEDVVAKNIKLKNVKTAILLSMHYTNVPPEPLSERTPAFRDIHIEDVTAENVQKCCTIEGLEERAIENITLVNLDLSGVQGVSVSYGKNIEFNNVKVAAQNGPTYKEDHSTNVQRDGWVDAPFVAAKP